MASPTLTPPGPPPTVTGTPDDLPDLTPPSPGRDLLTIRPVSAVLRSRWYPRALQIPVAAVFGLVAYELLAGPDTAHENAGGPLY